MSQGVRVKLNITLQGRELINLLYHPLHLVYLVSLIVSHFRKNIQFSNYIQSVMIQLV